MDDDPEENSKAGPVIALVVAPLLVLCCLGPVLFASVAGSWLVSWVSGVDPLAATGVAVIIGILVFALISRKRARKHQPAVDIRPAR